jgi:hypothetical protein
VAADSPTDRGTAPGPVIRRRDTALGKLTELVVAVDKVLRWIIAAAEPGADASPVASPPTLSEDPEVRSGCAVIRRAAVARGMREIRGRGAGWAETRRSEVNESEVNEEALTDAAAGADPLRDGADEFFATGEDEGTEEGTEEVEEDRDLLSELFREVADRVDDDCVDEEREGDGPSPARSGGTNDSAGD